MSAHVVTTIGPDAAGQVRLFVDGELIAVYRRVEWATPSQAPESTGD